MNDMIMQQALAWVAVIYGMGLATGLFVAFGIKDWSRFRKMDRQIAELERDMAANENAWQATKARGK